MLEAVSKVYMPCIQQGPLGDAQRLNLKFGLDAFSFDLIASLVSMVVLQAVSSAPCAMASSSRALGLILFTLVVCQVATARPLSADPTPRERVQQAFKEITTLSDNLRIATLKITIFNAGQQGFVIAQGFTGIITKIAEYTAHIPDPSSNPSPFDDADAKLVVESLTTFVQVHQALLNVVIGKHGLLTLVPFFEPIRISLVSLEAVVDTFAYKLIAMIPTQKPAATKQFDSLGVTVQLAINTYETPFIQLSSSK